MTISSIVWLDGPVDIQQLCRRIEERVLVRHPAFSERVVASRIPGWLPRWEEVTDLDLDAHLRVVDLPAPGSHALLEARCSLERSSPFDRDRPLWAMTIYRGYRGDGTAIHTRIHHCLGDGIALMQLFAGLCDEHPDVPSGNGRAPLPARLLGVGHQAATRITEHARHPTALVTTGRQAVATASWTARLFLPTVVERNLFHGTPQGTKLMVWDPDGYPLDQVKTAGHRSGVTVNEVLLTIVSGALHRYLAEHDALVDEVLMMVPVSLRDPSEPLPRYLDNRIGLLPFRLPVRSSDPKARLAGVRAQSEELKGSPAAVVAHGLLAGTALATAPVERGLHRFNQWRSTGVLTNVPGPSDPLHLTGARVLGSIGWGGLTAELNLSGAFISFGGRIFAGFVTDAAITGDPERLLAHVQAEWPDVLASLADRGHTDARP